MLVKSAVVQGSGHPIIVKDVNLSDPKNDEVLIRVVGSGLCHTDLAVKSGRIHSHYPVALGHEGAGIIEKVGSGITEFAPGDHVVVSFPYCDRCKNCLTGHPASCNSAFELSFGGKMQDGTSRLSDENGQEIGSLFGQASLSTYIVTNKNNLVKVDKDLDLKLLGPLACGIQTGAGTVLNKLKPSPGDCIVVFGCGGVGMSAIMAAKILNCKQIICVDILDERLELAQELGATHILNGKKLNVVEEVKSITNGGADYAVESAGNSLLVKQAIASVRAGGIIAVVGGSGETTLNIHDDLIAVNKTIMGVVEGDSIPALFIPKMIDLYKKGLFPFQKLIKTYTLNQLEKALEDMQNGNAIKPVIIFE
ncbi:NAD(P)-dependent alcohol dehydrogenase [Lysinibacillus capsici]|uniref:NAD(P)-dependent alcohol dehydrogenase n=1 Tax=Lysinibacillus capsici TaxID=2115968 RepID=UPI003684B1FF